ncbi:uncharacterized protein ASPGLDRAFT_1292423 [Aspergillus glaucus CBS 516.65]|uniref:Uncharacterized protein n=1 Tax=Aspergillus glaucus CBS 516.65 TaxID=1160497 RepID=A0A1L9VPT9_ASPGL|nr:hypothetical protein ASPGLDRAFT_1292423 [Aspergillus glaucus CBS 516.65]OJJ85911.1 hypothetical protein ASPGLDRAFT_1292423 [Aspergillus glaucus CBS 516.65]
MQYLTGLSIARVVPGLILYFLLHAPSYYIDYTNIFLVLSFNMAIEISRSVFFSLSPANDLALDSG